MSISTYTELLAAGANWLSRSDMTSRLPECVSLAQAKINRDVRSTAMETKSASFSITGEYVAVPSDFLEARDFYITSTSPRYPLQYMSGDMMTSYYPSTGKPRFYLVAGSNFRFGPTPDGTYTATLNYYAKPATLATTTQETNSLFPSQADLYLYAMLFEAETITRNVEAAAHWKGLYDEVVAKINADSAARRWGGNSMAVRVG